VFAWQPTTRVFGHTLYVYPNESDAFFAVMQSRVHEAWARLHSSSMRTDLRYSPTDCYVTFPFPHGDPRQTSAALSTAGEVLHVSRADLMCSTGQGLTKTYNALKDPSSTDTRVIELRRLHESVDRAVLDAYGWPDVAVPPYGTPTKDSERRALERFEDEVIDRLFRLNAERAKAERASAAPIATTKKTTAARPKKKAGKGTAAATEGPGMFGEPAG
jgi:hypothetical protein